MSKKLQDSVLFAVMSILIFAVFSLSFTCVTGSSGAGIRYLDLHWITVRQDIWVTSVSHIYIGTLAAMITASFGVTWALSRVLTVLHRKKSHAAWLLFTFVVVLYLMFATIPNFALS
jgi:hypothetical protein